MDGWQPQFELVPYATHEADSRGRLYDEPESATRGCFQRDRDRIIHAAAFRRLAYKTQVFVNHEGDFFRTRLTHSLEVAQIARSICRCLKLNEDLGEALALAHDLGHPPFGHAGEIVLNNCMKNHGGFNHNIQTLRIVMLLENKYYNFTGLNLTIETLDGLIKHNGPIKNKSFLESIPKKKLLIKKINFKKYPSLEAQVAAISDDIAYNNHDLEDGLRAGLFDIKKLKSIPLISELIKKHIKNIKIFRREIIISQIIRELINLMVTDVVKTTKKTYILPFNNLEEIQYINIFINQFRNF